ncbi:apolipoprotein N-acyltransferase [Janibacter cremeus]|uniref:Apolipoprotein N-acyltransferase n=1 Tax=Janibacter cremeus TaxID=1285192 RepID=A0A852VHR5_9MICO|nr:apolipoprotein N-acyltransferase [Janibacter cremeus]
MSALPLLARPVPARLLLAITGGLLLWLSFPDHDVAVAAVGGVVLISVAMWDVRPRLGALLGFLAGFACFVPTLSWSGIYVGAFPWFALATFESLYVALMGAVLVWVQRPLIRRGRALPAALLVPVLWVLQELMRGTVPYGGFPWARIAFSQADSPLARWAAIGGAPLITFVVALVAVPVVLLVVTRRLPKVALALTLVVGLGSWAVPVPSGGDSSARVGLVQGNVPSPGLDFNAERRAVLDNHVAGTQELAAKHDDLDLVIWPENASDIDPLRNPDAKAQVARAVEAVDTPLIVGAILDEPAPAVSNASLLYRPGGGEPERYVKQHPVPFAEYVPHRDFYRHFSDKVDLVRVGFAKGDAPAAFRIEGDDGTFSAIPTICFEVAYDGLMRGAVRNADDKSRPSLLVVQTNNATFGYTAESTQQYAISRIRAIEHGRSVAHVSTVGVSGFINPDGTSTPTTGLFTAAQPVDEVVLRSGLTVSDRLGPWVEWVCGFLLIGAGALRVRKRLAGRMGGRPSTPQTEDVTTGA